MLAVRNPDYVSAAMARRRRAAYIIGGEILPNTIAPVIVEMTIRVAFSVMLGATLGFLGVGAQPPSTEWGLMVAEARQYMLSLSVDDRMAVHFDRALPSRPRL